MSDRYEIERILQRVDTDLSLEQSRRLQLCLLRSYAAERHANLAQALVTRIDAGAAAGWQPGEQYELAASLLRLHGTSMTEPWRLDRIRALLVDSVRRMPLKDAEAVFSELFDRYPRSPSWHVKLLETLSEGRNDSFWMPYLIGNRLSYGNSAQDGRTALRLLAVAEERIPAKDPTERARLAAWVKFSVAQAWSKIYEYAQSADAYATAEQAVAAVETRAQKGWPSADDVYGLRINNSYYAGNLAEVERLAREWVSLGPEGDVARNQLVMVYLAKLDVAGALRESRGKLERHGGKDNDSLFEIAMFELVSGRPGYEGSARHVLEKTDHRYRDYIRLLLYWRLQREGRANHARALLEERWADVDRERWSERVNQGDTEVWREMLIGYFLGKVPWKRLSDPLADTAAFANSAYSQLGMTLPSIRAEAYFYNALLQHVSGDGATRRARFREQLELATRDRQLHVYEYHLARYLLKKRP